MLGAFAVAVDHLAPTAAAKDEKRAIAWVHIYQQLSVAEDTDVL
jgi:hypothetical protein